jgi:YihY family inner membrane protein
MIRRGRSGAHASNWQVVETREGRSARRIARCREELLQRPWRFLRRVVAAFRRNQGLLLSGAVAYYALLSVLPLFALLLVALSHFMDQERLLAAASGYVSMIMPAYTDALTAQLRAFLDHRQVVGWLGIVVLLFFSSMAFTVMESAMGVIFHHRVRRRHFLVSAVIPYLYILLLGVSVVVVTVLTGALRAVEATHLDLLGVRWSLAGAAGAAFYLLGVLGLVLMFSSLYLVMPVGRIPWRHALVGGATAAVLWELTRHFLIWYFSRLSLVSVVYGGFAAAVVALLSFEVAAIILLFGAQVIAEFERDGPCGEEAGPGP